MFITKLIYIATGWTKVSFTEKKKGEIFDIFVQFRILLSNIRTIQITDSLQHRWRSNVLLNKRGQRQEYYKTQKTGKKQIDSDRN